MRDIRHALHLYVFASFVHPDAEPFQPDKACDKFNLILMILMKKPQARVVFSDHANHNA